MEYLLDTQIALWIFLGSPRLPHRIRQRLDEKDSVWIFHQVSNWEIQIKFSLGKLPLPEKPEDFIPEAIMRSNLTYRTISDRAIYFLGKLPPIHRDPFDRLLIAHAITEGMPLATNDQIILQYPVPTVS